MTKRIYVILQGGGAKGISHVGAMRALEREGIDIKGIAGTSAGAIIASLKSVGFTAKDLFDPTTNETILSKVEVRRGIFKNRKRMARSPREIFGYWGWISIWSIRMFLVNIAEIKSLLTISLTSILILSILYNEMFLLIFFPMFMLLFIAIYSLSVGIASLDYFTECLNDLFANKLSLPRGTKVTFRDFDLGGALPLKIIATDVQGESVKIFSSALTPTVGVAEAVAASACIPGVFRASHVQGVPHFDGGIVSNLPAWVFDEERALDPEASTITLEIISKKLYKSQVYGFAALIAAVKTGLFGRGVLEKRAVGNLFSVGLTSNLGLLDFDMSLTTVKEEVDRAQSDCELKLVTRLVDVPDLMESVCKLLSDSSRRIIRASQRNEGVALMVERPRCAIMLQPKGTFNSLRLCYSYGFSNFHDGSITLPIDRSIVGRAWSFDASVLVTRQDSEWFETLDRPEDQATKRLVKNSLEWIFALPYLSARVDGGRFVLAIDGHTALGLSDEGRQKLVDELKVTLGDLCDDLVPNEVFEDGY